MISQHPHPGIALAGLVALMLVALATDASTAVAQPQSQTFQCTGSQASFTVPDRVTQLHIEAHGGQGQTRSGSLSGGYGGTVTATVPVTPGEVLDVFAACEGDHDGNFGWGAGGDHGVADASDAEDGGYGGGGSAVVRSDQTPLVVAGGGGDGGDGGGGGAGGQGGAGGNGGIDPQPGERGCTAPFCGSRGGGDGGCAACASGPKGGSGTGSSAADSGGGGGGGGGGHVGGGGGHGGSGFAFGDGGGGGGGGSSYVISSATDVSYGTDSSGGDGIVVLNWTTPPPAPGSVTYTCSDGGEAFDAPEGLTEVRVELRGASGASGAASGDQSGGAGGLGGTVTATLPIPNATNQLWVRAGCLDGSGFATGGSGGTAAGAGAGGNGGGASGLSVGYPQEVLLVAAGGGGGGGAGTGGEGGAGGSAGGAAAQGQSGGGDGGAGGCDNGNSSCSFTIGNRIVENANGSTSEDGSAGTAASDQGGGGGGGGGGYYYGGGGGLGAAGQGGGGGGGSGQSIAASAATDVSYGTASSGGDGLVIISWPVSDPADQSASDPPAPVPLTPLEEHDSSEARAINGWGQIAGFSSDGTPTAILWDRHGRPRALPPLEGDSGSRAFAINRWGQVVGDSIGATTSAVRWRLGQPLRLAPPDGAHESFARGINRRGEVAGWSSTRNDGDSGNGTVLQAVRWSADGTPTVLPPLDGDLEAMALAINDRGQVVGHSFSAGDPVLDRAVVWNRRGEPSALLPDAGADSEAAAINLRGVVAGDSEDDVESAALWRANRDPDGLDALDGDLEGQAFAINRQGTAAGISRSEATTAVVWARGGRPAALAPLPGDQESWAWGINSRGDVVGFSSGEAGTRAVLWPASRPHLGKKLPGDRRFAR